MNGGPWGGTQVYWGWAGVCAPGTRLCWPATVHIDPRQTPRILVSPPAEPVAMFMRLIFGKHECGLKAIWIPSGRSPR